MVLGDPASDALVAMQRLVRDASEAGRDRLDEQALAEQVTGTAAPC